MSGHYVHVHLEGERTSERMKELGKAAQVYPSWVRAVCRSQYKYDPVELLEELRKDSIDKLETRFTEYLEKYAFLQRHRDLLLKSSVQDAQCKLHYHATIYEKCQFVQSEKTLKNRQSLCCSCPKIRDYLVEQTKEYQGCTGDARVRC